MTAFSGAGVVTSNSKIPPTRTFRSFGKARGATRVAVIQRA